MRYTKGKQTHKAQRQTFHLHLPLLYPSPAMSTGTHIRQVWGQCQGQKPRSSSQIQCFHYSRIRKFSAASRMTTMGPLCMGKKQKYLTHKTSIHQFSTSIYAHGLHLYMQVNQWLWTKYKEHYDNSVCYTVCPIYLPAIRKHEC